METFKNKAVLGTHLAQVFAVQIKCINDGVEKCDIYGNILVQDDRGDLVIYKKAANEFECVHQGGTLTLAQPFRPTFACTNFSFNLDLKDANGNEFIKNSHLVNISGRNASVDDVSKELSNQSTDSDVEEEEICDESIGYDIEKGMGEEHYDNCIGVDVQGEMGVVTVYFCLLKVAVPARITAKCKMSDGIDFVEVSGSLVARYGKRFDKGGDDEAKYCRVVLFSKESDEGIVVDKGSKDPIIKSLVAIPAYSSVILQGKFHCVYSNKEEEELPIAEEFQAKYIHTVRPSLKGRYGDIELELLFIGVRRAIW